MINNFKQKHLISKNFQTEVYEVIYHDVIAILKIHKDKQKYQIETRVLEILQNKAVFIPTLFDTKEDFSNSGCGFILESKLEGDNLLEKYNKLTPEEKSSIVCKTAIMLGDFNKILNKVEIDRNLEYFFKKDMLEFGKVPWKEFLKDKIKKWTSMLCSSEDCLDYELVQEFLIEILNKIKISSNEFGLIHRDYGFRNILISSENEIAGIIDFEHSMIGDILFDTTKIIFNNLNFKRDKKLVQLFLNSWQSVTSVKIDEKKLYLYLAVQGLGVLQWCSLQKNPIAHLDYLNKGREILEFSLDRLGIDGKCC
ncbi:aminoglycoside phosphotransferase family protein [Streptococcus equinus]|uniref:aminoglycoside phosphotransferase family protein n=1 Tax=Streptococcus equinus TaxID=1335 RepID=UPI00046292CC|nr:aminoglycoside phosphotransferase family protein [Streptococcus equinus]